MTRPSKKNGMVAMGGPAPSKDEEGVFGRLVGWDLCAQNKYSTGGRYTPHDILFKACRRADLDPELWPEARTEDFALTRTVKDELPSDCKSEKLTDGGYAITRKQNTRDVKGANVEPMTDLRVWRIKGRPGELRFDVAEHPLIENIRKTYRLHVNCFCRADFSDWFCKILYETCGATTVLRKHGGSYCCPHDTISIWVQVEAIIKDVTQHYMDSIRCFTSDDCAMASVLHGITKEAESLQDDLDKALEKHVGGSKVLGSRALETLRNNIEAMEAKLKRYEGLLGKSLASVTDELDTIDTAVAHAIIAVEAEKRKAKAEKVKAKRRGRK